MRSNNKFLRKILVEMIDNDFLVFLPSAACYQNVLISCKNSYQWELFRVLCDFHNSVESRIAGDGYIVNFYFLQKNFRWFVLYENMCKIVQHFSVWNAARFEK